MVAFYFFVCWNLGWGTSVHDTSFCGIKIVEERNTNRPSAASFLAAPDHSGPKRPSKDQCYATLQ